MSEIKVRLSLSVPGAQKISWEEAQKNPQQSYDTHRIKVEFDTDKGKQQETLVIKTRKQKLIKQNIQISKEAYEHMINEAPLERVKGWASMSRNQKLHYHFQKIAESLGAKDYHFEILDD